MPANGGDKPGVGDRRECRLGSAQSSAGKRDLDPAVKVLTDEWQAFCVGSLRCGFMETAFKPLTGETEHPPSAISAGLKVPVICAALLADGVIRKGDTVIWEEPESHLHPRLRVLLAELLVRLQKALQLHVLITTNSSYSLVGTVCAKASGVFCPAGGRNLFSG